MLVWKPPNAYTDNTPLSPGADLDTFEIYIKEGGGFSDSDDATAVVAAVDPQTGQVTTSFNLMNLSPYLSQGVVYHVSIRALARNGLRSGFSPSATFSF
jgi:hypothetical protein